MIRTDLLVVGAGPAGSALAILAARAGLGVTLVEARAFPRDKVCGEFISAEGCAVLDRIGLRIRLRQEGAEAIDDCRISDLHGRSLDLALPVVHGSAAALGFSRARMDELLLEEAANAGARVLQPCRAVHPVLQDGRAIGVRVRWRDTAEETIFATAVVGADGRRSALLRGLEPQLGDPQTTTANSLFGLKTHLRASSADLHGRVELHLFDGGYVGLGEVEGGRINLCMIVRVDALRDCRKSPDRLLADRVAANPAYRQGVGRSQRCAPWNSVGPLRFGARTPTSHGLLFIGDAAGTIDPFCGEGISNALLSAELVLPFVAEAAANGGLAPDRAADYAREWILRFGGVTRRVRTLGRLFEHPRLATTALTVLRGIGSPLAPRLLQATRTGFATTP